MIKNFNYKQLKNYNSVSKVDDLSNDNVDMWRAFLDIPTEQLTELNQILSQDEHDRAERFVFNKHRIRFIACRGFLRKILSLYLDQHPGLLKFDYDSRGKPSIVSKNNRDFICFNLSHSKNMALFAISRYCNIGIDVEYIRKMSDLDQLVKRFFSPEEYNFLNSFSGNEKQKTFFKMWTIKEAYLKATGEGLSGLDDTQVCFDSEMNCLIMRNNCILSDWSVYKFKPAPGYVGAMVIKNYGDY